MGSHQQAFPNPGNQVMTNASYEYNANRIPGLAFGMPSLPPPSYRPEITPPSWHSVPPPTVPAATASPQAHDGIPSLNPSLPSLQPGQHVKDHNPPREQLTRAPTGHAPPHLQQPVDTSLEEGELSEEDFRDLYEPQEVRDTAQDTAQDTARDTTRVSSAQVQQPSSRALPLQASGPSQDRVDSASDADGSSLYNTRSPRDAPTVDNTSASALAPDDEYNPEENGQPATQRDRSGSYSPYLSPSELQRKASVNNMTAPKDSTRTKHSDIPTSSFSSFASSGGDRGQPRSPSNNRVAPVVNPNLPSKSVSEAKKKAQEAILGLWPLKIRYQHYVDEGFDESVVKSLFSDLGLETLPPKSTSVLEKPSEQRGLSSGPAKLSTGATLPSESHANVNVNDKASTTINASKPDSSRTDPNNSLAANKNKSSDETKMTAKPAKTAAEERKDKIARKLAAKAQKTTVTPSSAATPSPSSTTSFAPPSSLPAMPSIPGRPGAIPTKINTTVPSAPSLVSTSTLATPSPGKIKTRAENNAILHQKLAALRKKEQEKAAAGAETKPATPIQLKVTTPSEPLAVRTNGSVTNASQPPRTSVSAQPQPQTPSQIQPQAQAQPQPTPKSGAIPGLLPTLQTTQAKPRVLKRPVASDFDGYSPNHSALKRSRTQETLIIDVSDDEDVEMEIGSPTDGPATSATPSYPPGHQTPLATHPPLSDSVGRKQRSSPVSAVQTPEKAGKLNLLHGRIAEAEAKKKSAVKTSNDPQTPPTQPSPASEPITLPKVLTPKKEGRKPGVERRDRIASVDLPAVEATLKEKRDRLKELVSLASQLELDLQAAEAERQRLAEEMKELGAATEEDSTEPSNQSLQPQNSGMCQMIDPAL